MEAAGLAHYEKCRPLRLLITPGQAHDVQGAALLSGLAGESVIIADEAYDHGSSTRRDANNNTVLMVNATKEALFGCASVALG